MELRAPQTEGAWLGAFLQWAVPAGTVPALRWRPPAAGLMGDGALHSAHTVAGRSPKRHKTTSVRSVQTRREILRVDLCQTDDRPGSQDLSCSVLGVIVLQFLLPLFGIEGP